MAEEESSVQWKGMGRGGGPERVRGRPLKTIRDEKMPN